MAGRYSRTYSRKKSATPPISQFDRLVSEHGKSTHPVASKTAGHIGKWGMTSFTSLRSISENYGKEESGKRTWLDSPPPGSTDVSTSGAPTTDSTTVAPIPKRRKFFKSRDYNNVSNSISSPSSSSNCEDPSTDITSLRHAAEDYCPPKSPPVVNNSLKSSESSHTKRPKSHCGGLSVNKSGGGIKLKIFKSRNNDVNALETYSSTVQLPSDDSGSSSNSSSVANSPKCDLVNQSDVKCTNSPNGLVVPDPHPSDCNLDPVESLKVNLHSDNLQCNSDIKSNLSYHDINAKLQSSPLLSTTLDMPDNPAESQELLGAYGLPVLGTTNTDGKESTLTNKEQNGSPELTTQESSQDTEEITKSTTSERDPLSPSAEETVESNREHSSSPAEELKTTAQKDVDLFSTDFDENEIIDRTNIEYSTNCNYNFKEAPVTRSSTIDLKGEEAASSKPSTMSTRSNTYPKSISQEDYDAKASTLSKKRSFFKSRQKEGDSKKRATYKHKWHGHEDKDDSFKKEELAKAEASSSQPEEDPFSFDATPVLKRVQTWPSSSQGLDNSLEEESITSVKCPKQAKKYYTVIKNVKNTFQLQESGEFQEFTDDVDYFLDALRNSNTVSMRCLASLNLAQKCMTPAFRMHLRAHATVTKFFRALSDAPTHPQLAECAAMVMFALSQDRLNMDLDRGSLELMLNLLETDSSFGENVNQIPDAAAAADHSAKIRTLCKELQIKGHAKHLKLNNITAATLAMETLLSLTSKRAGEWFKEELREVGGVDHLIRTVTSSCQQFDREAQAWTTPLLEKLSKIDRCLKVLENVTHQNEANQEYLLTVNNGEFADTLMSLFRMCRAEVPLHPMQPQDHLTLATHNPAASKGVITALITTLKVLINLTHGSRKEALGSSILGQEDTIYNISIYCLLMMPLYLDHDTKFEIQVLACCLLLNLVEKSRANRERLMNLPSPIVADDEDEIYKNSERETAMASLVALFYTSEESARMQEAHTDHIIDTDLTQENKEEEKKDEEIEETVARLLQKAGRHMEDTLIAAYTALLAGYCIMDSKEFEDRIRYLQPEGHFKTMVAVLKKFLHFMNLTATTSLLRSLKPTEQVVKYMATLDRSPEEEAEEKRKKEEKEEAAQAMAFEAFGF